MAPDHLLDSYQDERMPVARAVLRGSGRGHRTVFSPHPVMRFAREVLLVFTGSARSAGPAAATAARISDLHPEQVRPCVVVPEECDRTGRPADTVFVDTGRDAHRRYRAPAGGLLCLVRPDGHIGFSGESVDAAAVLEYLASFLSVPGSGATSDSNRQRVGSR
ncbi:MAG TPA: hypothetical protein VNP92_08440 [Actinophytocola sp.]|nr:hypothetical protein [Actinophytocola sp.]